MKFRQFINESYIPTMQIYDIEKIAKEFNAGTSLLSTITKTMKVRGHETNFRNAIVEFSNGIFLLVLDDDTDYDNYNGQETDADAFENATGLSGTTRVSYEAWSNQKSYANRFKYFDISDALDQNKLIDAFIKGDLDIRQAEYYIKNFEDVFTDNASKALTLNSVTKTFIKFGLDSKDIKYTFKSKKFDNKLMDDIDISDLIKNVEINKTVLKKYTREEILDMI